MHREFAILLEQALSISVQTEDRVNSLIGERVFNKISEAELTKLIEVTDCPAEQGAELASNLAFKLAARFVEDSDTGSFSRLTPYVLAEELIQILCSREINSSDYFSFKIGGDGYINASITSKFKEDFLKAVFSSEARSFFCPGSFFSNTLESNVLYVEPIRYEWLEIFKRARVLEPEEVEALVGLGRDREFPVHEVCLMLLGSIADRELDLRVYRRGLSGRQNIPWLLRKYFTDSKDYLGQCSAYLGKGDFSELGGLVIPDWSNKLVSLILNFRYRYFLGSRMVKPELFFAYLLQIIREFYSLYNLPKFRYLSPGNISPQEALLLSKLLEKLLNLVELALSEIERSCENAKLILGNHN